ncbi:hypothetical protein [Neisseria leonii]|uniref:hypothetical protein n=1 Tax=Neisseria leonii TaxID=2995413 RepID=UPI00237BC67E|nr:hypothetical protein [Neisseria sp. 3986]MDD9324978.1 hypothetical protein [Neisseria sp. 3986]
MENRYTEALARLLPRQTATIQSHVLDDGQQVWIRRTGKTIPAWHYRILGGIARLLELDALRPVPNFGGQTALDTEQRRLRQLAAQGVSVPPLLAALPGGIMFGHLGSHSLLAELENGGSPLQTWQDGLAAIAAAHAGQAYLSQAFIRNMVRLEDGGIGFIDFEDDPGEFLTLPMCQSRDWFCYLQSTALWLDRRGVLAQAAGCWRQHAAALPPEQRAQIRTAARHIAPLRRLRSRKWGSDTLRLARMAELLGGTDT